MLKLRACLAMAACALAANAFAQTEVKGIALGSLAGDAFAKMKAPARCAPDMEAGRCIMTRDHLTYGYTTLADAHIDSMALEIHGGRVAAISISFDSDDYADIRDAYRSKYAGMKCAPVTVTTKVGAKIKSEECTWATPDAEFALMMRAGSIDEGYLSVTSKERVKSRATEGQSKCLA